MLQWQNTASEIFSITNGYVRNSKSLQNPLCSYLRALELKWRVSRTHLKIGENTPRLDLFCIISKFVHNIKICGEPSECLVCASALLLLEYFVPVSKSESYCIVPYQFILTSVIIKQYQCISTQGVRVAKKNTFSCPVFKLLLPSVVVSDPLTLAGRMPVTCHWAALTPCLDLDIAHNMNNLSGSH
jgi:hypothetical protein